MQDYLDAPTVVTLWDRAHIARKPGKVCSMCKDPIEPGQRYTSTGMTVDGVFEHWVRHEYGEKYPSGCPKFRAIDIAEDAAQYERDMELWNPRKTA